MNASELAELRARLDLDALGAPEFLRPNGEHSCFDGQCLVPGIAFGTLTEPGARVDGPTILLCNDCSIVPLALLSNCAALVIATGDATSHVVIRARHLGIPTIRLTRRFFEELRPGQQVTVASSPRLSVVSGRSIVVTRDASNVRDLARTLRSSRSTQVLANIDTSDDAAEAMSLDLDGVGMWRTENSLAIRFWKDRTFHDCFSNLLSDGGSSQSADVVAAHLEDELLRIAELTWPRPVTARLLDASMKVLVGPDCPTSLSSVRGTRLGIVFPKFADWQLGCFMRGWARAAERCQSIGPARILLPMVVDPGEVEWYRRRIDAACLRHGFDGDAIQIGVTIETPRAAITLGSIALLVDFVSFGTNDLTQCVWVLDRDYGYSAVVASYMREGILAAGPYQPFDRDGVGLLLSESVQRIRRTGRPVAVGISGELGSESRSATYLQRLGIDYVSVSPGVAARVCLAHSLPAAVDHETPGM